MDTEYLREESELLEDAANEIDRLRKEKREIIKKAMRLAMAVSGWLDEGTPSWKIEMMRAAEDIRDIGYEGNIIHKKCGSPVRESNGDKSDRFWCPNCSRTTPREVPVRELEYESEK